MWLAHSGCWVQMQPSAQGRLGAPTLGSPSPAHPVKWHYRLGKKCLAHLNMYLLHGVGFPLRGEVNTCPQGHLCTKVHSTLFLTAPPETTRIRHQKKWISQLWFVGTGRVLSHQQVTEEHTLHGPVYSELQSRQIRQWLPGVTVGVTARARREPSG